ncbi:MAG: hypothetical protein QHC90_26025 [Shinella sp.]|jgi:hypothetical protein|nr:hypothetical protein [Shinella sp.]
MIDAKAFGLELAGIVKAQLSPLIERMNALEKRIDALPAPVDLSADLARIKAAVEAIEIPDIPPLPELPDIEAMVEAAVNARMPEDMERSIEDVVRLVVSEIPLPANGKDGADGKHGRDGKDGKDGVDLAGAFIDRDGELVLTLSNGEVRKLGPVIGRDGKDGAPGAPGRDGFNLEDFDAEVMKDGRTVLLSFDRGDLSYKIELGFPVMIYRGVFKDGQKYERGDTVTWGGSLWHCDVETTSEKPDSAEKHWTLAAKRGRDGKDGEMKEAKSHTPVRVGVPARAE